MDNCNARKEKTMMRLGDCETLRQLRILRDIYGRSIIELYYENMYVQQTKYRIDDLKSETHKS